MRELKENRNYILYLLLNSVTCGFFGMYVVWDLSRDVNEACEEDGEKTRGLGVFLLLNVVSWMAYRVIWWYQVCKRLNNYCAEKNIKPAIGSLEFLVLHLIPFGKYYAKFRLFKLINAVATHYNSENEEEY